MIGFIMANINDTIAILGQGTANKSHIYRSESARQVRSRSNFLQQAESGEERAGVNRLNKLLEPGTELNRDAPRGFYLNIRV